MTLFSSFRKRKRGLRHAVASGLFLVCLAALGVSGSAVAAGIDAVKLQVNVPYAFLPLLKGAEGAAFASEKKEGTFPAGRFSISHSGAAWRSAKDLEMADTGFSR